MKRSSFRKPTYKEALEKKKKAQQRARERALERQKSPPKPSNPKDPTKVLKITKAVPKWIKAIPASKSHGSGTYQKRLWKLTSDFVRIRDFYQYGVCAVTGKRFETWRGTECHAGHLKPYSTCNGLFKFDIRNIHAQHGNSNKFGNYDDFRNFEAEVKRRGYDWDQFEKENNQNHGCRLYDSEVIEQIEKMLTLMGELPEQPDYYERAISLLEEYRQL